MIKTLFDINIPESFIKLFHIIIKAKKSKEVININELLKTEWLNEINDEIQSYEDIFKKDFEELYKTIIEDNVKNNIINIDIKNILEENKEEISPFNKFYSCFDEDDLNEKTNINTKYFNNINANLSWNSKDYIEKEKKNNFNSMNKSQQIVEKKDIEEKEEKKQDLKKIKKEKIQINKKEDNSLEKSLSSESSERKEEVKHKKKKKNSKGNIFNILKNLENKSEKKNWAPPIIKNEKEKEEEEFIIYNF